MLLRPTASGDFLVVGESYVLGLMDGESVLGQLPKDFTVEMRADEASNREIPHFRNISTNQLLIEDPRLPTLPAAWEEVKAEMSEDDIIYARWFKNAQTGEVIEHDPRLIPESLRAQGIPIQNFRLI